MYGGDCGDASPKTDFKLISTLCLCLRCNLLSRETTLRQVQHLQHRHAHQKQRQDRRELVRSADLADIMTRHPKVGSVHLEEKLGEFENEELGASDDDVHVRFQTDFIVSGH